MRSKGGYRRRTIPTKPSSQLVKQSVILAAMRITYGGSAPVVASVEDKRVFSVVGHTH